MVEDGPIVDHCMGRAAAATAGTPSQRYNPLLQRISPEVLMLLAQNCLELTPYEPGHSWGDTRPPNNNSRKPKPPQGKRSNPRRSKAMQGRQPAAGTGALSTRDASADSTSGLPRLNFQQFNLFPPRYRAKMRYVVGNNNTLTTGTAGAVGTVKQYRLNSLYDPELTDAGHQPYGYDTLTTIYNRYKVHSVEVTALFTIIGSTADLTPVLHFMPSSATTSMVGFTPEQALEKPGTQGLLLPSSGARKAVWKGRFPISTLLGMSPREFLANTEDTSSVVSTNPAKVPILEVGMCSLNATAGEGCAFSLTFIFDCEFLDRVDLPES